MIKPYLNYQQQIEKLKKQGLIINDEEYATGILTDIGHSPLIGGYKMPFINPMTRKYLPDTTFEDIVALYDFDKSLRDLTLSNLLRIERKVGQLITNSFCSRFGPQQSFYLSPSSYTHNSKKQPRVQKLIGKLKWLANNDTNHDYITHQRKTYGNVPFWELRKALTFGNISAMYSLLLPQQQSDVSKAYSHVTENELEIYLNALTFFRNICAHSERLYCHRMSQMYFPDKPLHIKLGIPKKGQQFIQGKNDYFGLVIAMRYLLPKDQFSDYKKSLKKLILAFQKRSSRIPYSDLLEYMGMPDNWEKITRFRL